MTIDNPELKPMNDMPNTCPFCDKKPAFGLTKKTGCQLHGDPIQYITLGCYNQLCKVRPRVIGGDRYAHGDFGEFFKEQEKAARQEAVSAWNTRAGEKS